MHGHANQLLRHLHRNLVVTDEQKLGFFAHALDQFGVPLCVRVVQGGVHLVQQTKRCWVELKNGKHQGNGREGLLAPRQQVNGLIFLPWRLSHDLNTRVQNFIARHDQAGAAAAKQLREHAAKMFIHNLESASQEISGFSVNFLDGIFKRGHGFG